MVAVTIINQCAVVEATNASKNNRENIVEKLLGVKKAFEVNYFQSTV